MNVLLADDDVFARRVLVELLGRIGYEVTPYSDGLDIWNAIERVQQPTVLLLGLRLPRIDGLEICRRLKEQREGANLFSILLPTMVQKEEALKALEIGADDYALKPVDPHELRARLRNAKRVLDLQAALKLQQTRDPLTGIWNRPAILDVVKQEVARAERKNESVSILLVNVDNMKQINGTYGNFVGDAVLCEVARRLRTTVRAYDVVGRCGGDEFLIVIPSCGVLPAAQQSLRLRSAVARKGVDAGSRNVAVTCCIGVASSDTLGSVEPEVLLLAVDRALRRAKSSGRDQTEVASARDFAERNASDIRRTDVPTAGV